jgi:hypothetical protein
MYIFSNSTLICTSIGSSSSNLSGSFVSSESSNFLCSNSQCKQYHSSSPSPSSCSCCCCCCCCSNKSNNTLELMNSSLPQQPPSTTLKTTTTTTSNHHHHHHNCEQNSNRRQSYLALHPSTSPNSTSTSPSIIRSNNNPIVQLDQKSCSASVSSATSTTSLYSNHQKSSLYLSPQHPSPPPPPPSLSSTATTSGRASHLQYRHSISNQSRNILTNQNYHYQSNATGLNSDLRAFRALSIIDSKNQQQQQQHQHQQSHRRYSIRNPIDNSPQTPTNDIDQSSLNQQKRPFFWQKIESGNLTRLRAKKIGSSEPNLLLQNSFIVIYSNLL